MTSSSFLVLEAAAVDVAAAAVVGLEAVDLQAADAAAPPAPPQAKGWLLRRPGMVCIELERKKK